MSRRGSRATLAASVAGAAIVQPAIDPATATPAIPSTAPLPSDQTASPPIAPAPIVATAAPAIESAPLPVPEHQPHPDLADVPAGARVVHVDSTVPLPSDQLTPIVATDGSTDTSATTDAAIAVERGEEVFDPHAGRAREDALSVVFGDRFDREARDDGSLAARMEAFQRRAAEADRAGLTPPTPESMLRAYELLHRDLVAAGFGVVTLAADTVELLRQMVALPPLAGAPAARTVADDQERRYFVVDADVHHDGKAVPPGDLVRVTRTEFERLHAGRSIAAETVWADGEPD